MTPFAEFRRRSDSGDALLLRSPDAVLSAMPYLLGFTPTASAVLIWVSRHRILLTQRLDLPSDDRQIGAWLEAMWAHRAASRADELIVVLVTDRADAQGIADAVLARASEAELPVRDALRLSDGRWWSLLCTDPQCCGPRGRVVSARVRAAIAAEFTLMGVAPLADRAALVAALDEDPEAAGRLLPLVQACVAAMPATGAAREAWRDAAVEQVQVAFSAQDTPLRDDDVALLVVGLSDIRVRDTVLWETTRLDPDALHRGLSALTAAVRCTPNGWVAPVATACATVAWLVGDGARALIAVERALLDDPDYSLAILVVQSLQAGLPPDSWREALAALSRDECRHGSATRPRRRAS
ncbi:MAG: DUF4192 domain-containing protein [Actinobacteria bacterium]|jgi:hypothetical protein|nr:DUF4192 domain-containing protein [Actinomycetota bacterium]